MRVEGCDEGGDKGCDEGGGAAERSGTLWKASLPGDGEEDGELRVEG